MGAVPHGISLRPGPNPSLSVVEPLRWATTTTFGGWDFDRVLGVLETIAEQISSCRDCPRLVEWREAVAVESNGRVSER